MKKRRVCRTGKLSDNLPRLGEEKQAQKDVRGRQRHTAARGGRHLSRRSEVVRKDTVHDLNIILQQREEFN
ncbi:MAG: hypothetical protein C4534_03125 [Gaiellales bacterium]|nr:MAG: hypothetical protein C4534_03125 [Gaiellales bacterium]